MKLGLGIPPDVACEGYATGADPEDVMKWYRGQMSDWTLVSEDSFSPPEEPDVTIFMQYYRMGDEGAFISAVSDPMRG